MSPTSSNAQMKKPMIPRITAPAFTGIQQQHVLMMMMMFVDVLKLWPMDEKSTLLLFKLFKNGISCSWHTKWRLSLLRLQNQFILYSCVHLKTRSDKNLQEVDLTFVYRRPRTLR